MLGCVCEIVLDNEARSVITPNERAVPVLIYEKWSEAQIIQGCRLSRGEASLPALGVLWFAIA